MSGWVPKEEWKGDPDKWKSKEQWIEDGENILPIVQSQLNQMKEDLKESKAANQQAGEFFRDYQQRQEKETAVLKEKLEKAKQQAVTDGDGEAFIKAEQDLANLQPTKEQMTPVQQGFIENNTWYGKNEDLTIFADGVADRLVQQGFIDQSPAYFEELTRRVKDRFPKEFENPNRQRAGNVEDGGTRERKDSKAHVADNLPDEAKAAGERFVKQKLFKSLDDYAKAYDWS